MPAALGAEAAAGAAAVSIVAGNRASAAAAKRLPDPRGPSIFIHASACTGAADGTGASCSILLAAAAQQAADAPPLTQSDSEFFFLQPFSFSLPSSFQPWLPKLNGLTHYKSTAKKQKLKCIQALPVPFSFAWEPTFQGHHIPKITCVFTFLPAFISKSFTHLLCLAATDNGRHFVDHYA